MLAAAALICTPMVLSLLLVLAVISPKMDSVTMHLPKGVRSTVASGIMAGADYDSNQSKQERAKHLDPETVANYARGFIPARANKTPPAMEEMYRQQRESKKAAKDLVRQAGQLEKNGKQCDAEELYTQAAGKDPSGEVYEYTEGMGRAGLRCGDLPGARSGLEVAITKEKDFIKGTDEDQLADVRGDLLKDREFLMVVYEREHEDKLAAGVCRDAHENWKGCTCALGKDGDVKCTERH